MLLNTLFMMTIINILFPVIGLIFFFYLFVFYFEKTFYRKIFVYNIFYSISYLAYLYIDIKGRGDVTRYILYNEKYSQFTSLLEMFKNTKFLLTYLWSFMNYIINKLDINFQIISFISIFIILYCTYKNIELSGKNIKINKVLLIKFFMLFSLSILFSTYRNLLSFSLTATGIFWDMKKNKKGIFIIFLGMGIHLSSFPIILIYLLSKKIKFKIKYLYISCLLILLTRLKVIEQVLYIKSSNAIIKKFNYYIWSKWSEYRINSEGDYITYYLLFIMILLLVFSFIKIYKSEIKNNIFYKKYNNFIFLYLTIFMFFLPYRTFAIRLFITGFPFFIPLFYQMLLFYKKYSIYKVIFYYFLIDLRWFFIFFLTYFKIGQGFPINILSNILQAL